MFTTELNPITSIVAEVLDIADITSGSEKMNYLVRYRGRLRCESTLAYDRLAERLRPLGVTPLFRLEDDQHVVLITNGTINPRPSNPWINLLVFGLTVLSVLFAGVIGSYDGPAPRSLGEFFGYVITNIGSGVPFAASLLAILLAHEFGHYIVGRLRKTQVSLPYFLPFPFSQFGTMGAFIQLKEPPRNKRVLLDIGIAGPLAGLVVAIPILFYGLSLSRLDPIDVPPGMGIQLEGNSLLYLAAKYIVFGQLLPAPESYNGMAPALYWLRYFFTGQPLPINGVDVMIHPVAFAGWAGLLVTALNLIPAGQLDGGHVLYGLFGSRARRLVPVILVALVLLGLVWAGWWIWAALIFILGRAHAEPLDQITQLDPPRKFIGVLALIIFVLVFTPVPLTIVGF